MITRLWLWLLTALGFDPRGIYIFHDGRNWRRVDPLATYLRFFDIPGFDPDKALADLSSGDPQKRLKKVSETASAVRTAFRVLPLDSGGLTDLECIELLSGFVDYAEDLKKNIEPTPNWDPSTDRLPLGVSPTDAASAFGSTSKTSDASTAKPSDSES